MSGLNVRRLVVFGAALVAVAVLSVAVTLLVTDGGAQPERESAAVATSHEFPLSVHEGLCKAISNQQIFSPNHGGDSVTIRETTRSATSECVLRYSDDQRLSVVIVSSQTPLPTWITLPTPGWTAVEPPEESANQ